MGETEMSARRRWLSVLARAPRERLAEALADADLTGIDWPRPGETGMVMVEGRAGGRGRRFCVGQATVTRATAARGGRSGIGYVQGHDAARAEMMALADLMLQEGRGDLDARLLAPEAVRQAAVRDDRARAAAATQVEFFTMARQSGAPSS